jgi:osmotically-inducible protein OsmY
MNQLISARVRSALERHFGSDAGALIKAEVAAGHVVLTGPMVDAQYITEAARLVRAVEGVSGVESRIVPLWLPSCGCLARQGSHGRRQGF